MSNKINQKEKQLINVVETIPLSDDIIHKNLKNAKILKYSELEKYNTIEQLLPKEKAYVILLLEDQINSGHWMCLARFNNKILFFDSYGGAPDSQLKWNSKEKQHELGQSQPLLSHLLNNTKLDVEYNHIKYQKSSPNVNDCGRHVVSFLTNMLKFNRDLGQYYKLMCRLKKTTGLDFDAIVTAYFPKS